MVLNTTVEDDPSAMEMESMEASSSMDIDSYTKKRKAETDPKNEEETEADGECVNYTPAPKIDWLKAPEWDVDSFDGLEYYSSPKVTSSSDDDEETIEHTRIYKRQIIESKGFYVDRKLEPGLEYRRIRPLSLSLEWDPTTGKTFGQYWEEIVHICLAKYNQERDPKVEFVEVVRGNYRGAPRWQSYITFMAREKPGGPLVEYQAKGLLTFDGIVHPVLCRPAPTPNPEPEAETEKSSDGESRDYEREPEIDMLQAPEWDVDSFDGLEYYSSSELESSSGDDVEAMAHTRIYKRQIIESKGFYVDPELTPCIRYKQIRPLRLEIEAGKGITYRQYWEEMVHICLRKYNQDKDPKVDFVEVVRGNRSGPPRTKSYITFMAREKPDGPLVEYQAKCLHTFDGIRHPILCRPAPMPNP